MALRALLLFFVINTSAFATLFFPLPIDKQVEEATSAAEVVMSSSRVFKDSLGTIMTEYTFDVGEAYNLASEDLDHEKLKLTMPGGTLNGVTAMIDGAPQFADGEKNFLLLKKIENKIYLSNFTLGKYTIENVQGKTFYVSEVFPMEANVGRISKERMIELMKEKWKISSTENLKTLNFKPASKVVSMERAAFKKREPAQVEQSEDVPVFFWSALFLVSIFFAIIFVKLGQSGQDTKSE